MPFSHLAFAKREKNDAKKYVLWYINMHRWIITCLRKIKRSKSAT